MTWTAASSPRLTRCNTVWRETPSAHCLAHRQEVLTGITVEAILEVFGEADTPRGAGCRLLAVNNAVIEQAMDGRWGDTKHDGGLLDRQ